MNFNDIESAWKKDAGDGAKVPDSMSAIRSANLPLDKVRKNLRNEFYYQAIAIALLFFLPQLNCIETYLFTWFYIAYAMFVAICVYFLVKLYLFYKRVANYTLSTKDSLYEAYYDIRLNIELYKTFSFSLMPFIVIFIAMSVVSANQGALSQMVVTGVFPQTVVVQFAVGFALSMIVMAFCTEWWVRHFYGKYANEMKKVLDQLREE